MHFFFRNMVNSFIFYFFILKDLSWICVDDFFRKFISYCFIINFFSLPPHSESVNENCPLPTADQVKLLEEYISTRNYNVTILQPKIYLLAAEHPQKNVRKKQHTSRTDRVSISSFFEYNFHIFLNFYVWVHFRI